MSPTPTPKQFFCINICESVNPIHRHICMESCLGPQQNSPQPDRSELKTESNPGEVSGSFVFD